MLAYFDVIKKKKREHHLIYQSRMLEPNVLLLDTMFTGADSGFQKG